MTPDERCTVTRPAPGEVVVAVGGGLDALRSPGLLAAMTALIEAGTVSSFVVDLTEVDYLDSRGLGMLVSVRRIAVARGAEFRLVDGGNRTVRRVLTVSGLTALFRPASGTGDTVPAG